MVGQSMLSRTGSRAAQRSFGRSAKAAAHITRVPSTAASSRYASQTADTTVGTPSMLCICQFGAGISNQVSAPVLCCCCVWLFAFRACWQQDSRTCSPARLGQHRFQQSYSGAAVGWWSNPRWVSRKATSLSGHSWPRRHVSAAVVKQQQ